MGCNSSKEADAAQSAPRPAAPTAANQQQAGQTTATAGDTKRAQESGNRTASQLKVDARLAQIQPNDEIGRLLKNVPLLSKLSDAERAKLGGAVVEKNFGDGQKILTQGEPGTGFYIIRKGTVSVMRQDEQGRKHELATLKDGDFFGETALINDAKRGATVTSTGSVSTFYLERDDFEALFGKSRLNVQFAKRQAISAEQVKGGAGAADGAASTSAPPNAKRDKDHAAVHMISNVMKDNVVFMNLDAENKAQIIAGTTEGQRGTRTRGHAE